MPQCATSQYNYISSTISNNKLNSKKIERKKYILQYLDIYIAYFAFGNDINTRGPGVEVLNFFIELMHVIFESSF